MLRHIAAKMPVVGNVSRAARAEGGRPLTIALVGPTGVGKTTTIAKLAAAYKLRQGKKVGLITSDTYRIAAVDQLRTYATIIGLPLKVAMTPREMSAACSAFADCDAILIDTAGRSQHDANRLEELSAFIQACSPDETHLVLSATVAECSSRPRRSSTPWAPRGSSSASSTRPCTSVCCSTCFPSAASRPAMSQPDRKSRTRLNLRRRTGWPASCSRGSWFR
jgi:energy-coupling factor transporter ATP-binding protein EcfA2